MLSYWSTEIMVNVAGRAGRPTHSKWSENQWYALKTDVKAINLLGATIPLAQAGCQSLHKPCIQLLLLQLPQQPLNLLWLLHLHHTSGRKALRFNIFFSSGPGSWLPPLVMRTNRLECRCPGHFEHDWRVN